MREVILLIAGLAASVKAKVCRTVVRPAMLSGLETGTKAGWEVEDVKSFIGNDH